MAGYDTMTIASSTPDHILRLTAPQSGYQQHHLQQQPQQELPLINMDPFDQGLHFAGDGLLDDPQTGIPSLPFNPPYELSDGFSTFEDPFSYQSSTFEPLQDPQPADPPSGETTSTSLDNKLLGFGAPIMKTPVLDDRGQTWPTMSAELYGMFFVAEDVFGGETAGRPMELTCYRRNLFQISGTVTVSRTITRVIDENGQQIPIFDLKATLSALESIEGKQTEIISVPWKTSSATSSEDKAGAAPPSYSLDLCMNPELDPNCVAIPVAWKRLQFKHATANNGRRKGLQQHYVVQINLMATLATGAMAKIAEIQSGPIIVRGRSPRNFDGRKDVPLNEKKGEAKVKTPTTSEAPLGPLAKIESPATASPYRYYAMNALQQPLDLPDWSTLSQAVAPTEPSVSSSSSSQRPSPSKKVALSTPTQARPPVPRTNWKAEPSPSPSKAAHPISHTQVHPIDLSLSDDDQTRAQSRSSSSARRFSDSTSTAGVLNEPSVGDGKRKTVSSPVESADLLYEYFPLSLDDWMPPVDAIYRPHVVHHTVVPPDLKAQQVKNKTKRYFLAED